MTHSPGILSEMTTEEVERFGPQVVVLGVGSTEPHGPSMPFGTDYFFCDAVCREAVLRANGRGARALAYPTLPIGNNVNFKGYRFACRIRVRTLMNALLDIIEQIEEDGIRKIVLVNGHGGNTDAIHAVLREHFERHSPQAAENKAFVCMAGPGLSKGPRPEIQSPSPHGGEGEASRMLHLRPDLVRTERFMEQPLRKALLPSLNEGKVSFVKPWHLFIPLSGGGDTRGATAEKGKTDFESRVEGIASFLVELSQAPWGRNFPYEEA